MSLSRIRRFIAAAAGAAALVFTFAMAGLLGLALVLVPIFLAVLAMGFGRAKRWGRIAGRRFKNRSQSWKSVQACVA